MGGWIETESVTLEISTHCKIWMPSCAAYWEGSFWNNVPHGYGMLQAWDRQARPLFCYIGQWESGRRHGRGREITYSEDGSVLAVYDGEWLHGTPVQPLVFSAPRAAVASTPVAWTQSGRWVELPPPPPQQAQPVIYAAPPAFSDIQYSAADAVYTP